MIHLIYDGCGAADRLVAEKYRGDGLDSSQFMMVDDLLDICVFQTVYRLVFLVVVYQDDLLALCTQQISAGDHTEVLAIFI